MIRAGYSESRKERERGGGGKGEKKKREDYGLSYSFCDLVGNGRAIKKNREMTEIGYRWFEARGGPNRGIATVKKCRR